MKKRILSFVLALVMAVSLLPVSVLARRMSLRCRSNTGRATLM